MSWLCNYSRFVLHELTTVSKEQLATKLSYQETSNKTLTNELTSLKSQLQSVSDDKANIESSLNQLRLKLSSLEYSNNDQERAISRTEAHRLSAEKVSENAKSALTMQHSQLEDLRNRLGEAELELSKYKDLASRYQTDRASMKKRIKEKVEMIKEQEDSLVKGESETATLRSEMKVSIHC